MMCHKGEIYLVCYDLFNEQNVLCAKRLSEHFQFNKADNNNQRGPCLHCDKYNTTH